MMSHKNLVKIFNENSMKRSFQEIKKNINSQFSFIKNDNAFL